MAWPGNWVGCNAAGIVGFNLAQGSNIGVAFEGFNAISLGPVAPTASQGKGLTVQGQYLLYSGGLIDQELDVTLGIMQDWFTKLTIVGTTDSRYWIGVSDATSSTAATIMNSDTPSANVVAFRFATDADTTIKAVCQTGSSSQTVVDTGVAPSTSTPQLFEIVPTSGGASVTFYIDGTLVATITSNVPANTVPMNSIMCVDAFNNGSSNYQFNFYYFYMLLAS